MAKKNHQNLEDALRHPKHTLELSLSGNQENALNLIQRIPELENLTVLRIFKIKDFLYLPLEIFELKNLTELLLEDCSFSEIPEVIFKLKNLEILRIRNCPIPKLPESLGQLDKLAILECSRTSLATLPESISNLQSLKKLIIASSTLGAIPESIGLLKKLEHLEIANSLLLIIPPMLINLKALTTLILSANKLTTIPSNLSNLNNLTHLYFDFNELKSITLDNWANLKNLSVLNLAGNQFDKLPLGLEFCPALKEIHIACNNLSILPESILACKELAVLYLSDNPFDTFPEALLDWYVLPRKGIQAYSDFIINKELTPDGLRDLLKNNSFKKLNRSDKIAFFQIYQNNTKFIEKLSIETLYLALNTITPSIAEKTLAFLTNKLQKPLKKGSKVHILGKTITTITDLKERLENGGLQHSNELESATHVLISARANKKVKKWPSSVTWQWISEAQLNTFFDEVNPSYLIEATEIDTNKVSDLIMSLQEENMAIGLGIIEGGGLPESLFTEVFIIYKMSEDKALQKKAFDLLKAKASPELLVVLKKRSALNKKVNLFNNDRKNLIGLITEYTNDSGLDIGKLAYALFMKTTFGLGIAYQNTSTTLRKNMLFSLIKKDTFSSSFHDFFDEFPVELLDYPNLKKLSIYANSGTWTGTRFVTNPKFFIPKEIALLQELEELTIESYIFSELPLEALATLKKLKKIKILVSKSYNRRQLKEVLSFCKTIDIEVY